MNRAKMVSGLLARPGTRIWIRGAAFVAMAWGVWRLAAWAIGHIDSEPDGMGMAIIILGMMQVAVAIITAGSSADSLGEDTAKLPFLFWDSATDGGREIPIWVLAVEPLVIPAEVVMCAILALAWAFKGVVAVLGCKVRSRS